MKFDVNFESSKGNHPATINLEETKEMQKTGKLELTVPVGTDEEKKAMAQELLNSCT